MLPNSFEKQQDEINHTIIREQEVTRISNWVKHIIKTIDEVAADKKFACETLDSLIKRRFASSEGNKDFLEDVAAFWRHNIEYADMNKFHEQNLFIKDEDISATKTPYQRHLKEALTHLNLIETYAGVQVKRLNKIAGKFYFTLKNDLPRKKMELSYSLKHAQKCVQKEREKKEAYDRELNHETKKRSFFDWLRGRPRYTHGFQSMQWYQSMAKAQYAQAIRLTDDAFEKANLR